MFNLYNDDKVKGLISIMKTKLWDVMASFWSIFFDRPDLACVIVHTYSHMYGRLSKIP